MKVAFLPLDMWPGFLKRDRAQTYSPPWHSLSRWLCAFLGITLLSGLSLQLFRRMKIMWVGALVLKSFCKWAMSCTRVLYIPIVLYECRKGISFDLKPLCVQFQSVEVELENKSRLTVPGKSVRRCNNQWAYECLSLSLSVSLSLCVCVCVCVCVWSVCMCCQHRKSTRQQFAHV